MKVRRTMFTKLFKSLKKNWQSLIICLGITTIACVVLYNHFRSQYETYRADDFVYSVESKILDFKLRQAGADTSPSKVGILAIDERSLSKFGRWPFSRRYYAKAFRNLKKLGVSWVGFDAVWAEQERTLLADYKKVFKRRNLRGYSNQMKKINQLIKTSPSDQIFAQAIQDFSNIILGYFYFGSKEEFEINAGHRKPFIGMDYMSNSEIEAADYPEGKELDDYLIPKAFGVVTNTPIFLKSSEHYAFFSNDADEDAINRWITLVANVDGKLMPSLALKAAAEYLDSDIIVFFNDHQVEGITLVNREDEEKAIEIPLDAAGFGRLLIKHKGPAKSFHHFSLADAYDNTFTEKEKKELKGSVLLLGATATGINDIRPNPFDPAIDGVENHAAGIYNIIRQDFLKRPRQMIEIEFMIVLGVGLIFSPLLIWGHAISAGLGLIAFIGGFLAIDYFYWFQQGIWAFIAVPCGQILSMFLLTNIFKYISEEKDKKFLKNAFSNYISPELIEDMHNSGEPPKLGGSSGILTAYFTDIQGFSSFSEKLTATQLVELLNEYLTAMTDTLLEEKGTLDKYEGDAIIAFFGAPMKLEDHAVRACKVAVRMQEVLLELRKKWVSEGDKWPQIVKEMKMRIGINSGEIVTGNMGSRDRMNYTMMGDSVNLAARLEEAAKQYGIFTQLSHFTKDLTGDHFEMRELDTIRVVGKSEPVTTYDLLGVKGQTGQGLVMLKDKFHEGLAHYKNMDWDKAIATFEECQELEWKRYPELKGKKTNPSEVYIKRCQHFKEEPPPADWDRVYTLTSK